MWPDDARQADGEAAYQETLRTNAVFSAADVKAYVMARAAGEKPSRPKATPMDASKPMITTHD